MSGTLTSAYMHVCSSYTHSRMATQRTIDKAREVCRAGPPVSNGLLYRSHEAVVAVRKYVLR